jgi:hypothetical protein
MMKKLVMPVVFVVLLFFVSQANAVTPVQDPANGETNLYEVINAMMGTSFTSSQDPALTDLEVGDDDWWDEWDNEFSYISIVATYAGQDQNLWWENTGYSGDILLAALDGIHFYEDNPINFQTTGGNFYFKDVTSGLTWYSWETKNSDGLKHMVTYSFGNGIFICAFEDISGLGDHDYNDLVFKIIAGAAPITVPSISYIPDQAVSGGYPFPDINLDNYVRHDDEGPSGLTWTTSGGTNISVIIGTGRVATITYTSGWTGSESLTFTATDPGGCFDSAEVTFTVNSPDAPVVLDIPNQSVEEGQQFTPIPLDDYVYHPAPNIDDDDMTWTTSGGGNISVNISPGRVARLTYHEGWTGSETITFTATINPSSSDSATFTVFSSGSGGGGGAPVGGIVHPVDKFSLIAPWVALFVLMVAIVTLVVGWKRKGSTTTF